MIRTVSFAALALTAAAANAASSHDPSAPLAVHVRYHDLNLATPSGSAEFEHRINMAVAQVCAPVGVQPGRLFRNEALIKRCSAAAFANARPQMLAAVGHASGLAGVDKPNDIASR